MEEANQILFIEKTVKFLSNLPNPLPKLVWINLEGFAVIEKIQTIQNILSPDQILFI